MPSSTLRQIADSFFAVIFPTSCSLCHHELSEAGSIDICRDCWAQLEPWTGPACARCGRPFPSQRILDSTAAVCAQCRAAEFEFDLARSFAVYQGALRGAVLQLKFRRRGRLGKKLGELLGSVWEQLGEDQAGPPPILVPVPLYRSRERERGFNQAELLARGLSRKLEEVGGHRAPAIETHCLFRTRATVPQTGLSLPERKENVRGVFDVAHRERIKGRVVVLVDDVMTTGATLSACAAALKTAGAGRVVALTLARATPQFPDQDAAEPVESDSDWAS